MFNLTTLGGLAMVCYVYFTYTKLYEMMHPLDGVELVPGQPTVAPHWEENTTFSVLCFLSSARRFTPFKVSTLKEQKALLFINHGIRYNSLQGEITMHFNITTAGEAAEAAAVAVSSSLSSSSSSTSGGALSGLSGLLWPAAAPANVTTASVSNAIWKLLRTNTSSVHLHILAVKTSGLRAPPPKLGKPGKRRGADTAGRGGHAEADEDAGEDEEEAAPTDPDVAALGGRDEITAALLAEGSALYDVVAMVKWDRIPKVRAPPSANPQPPFSHPSLPSTTSLSTNPRPHPFLPTYPHSHPPHQSYAHRYLLRDVPWLVRVAAFVSPPPASPRLPPVPAPRMTIRTLPLPPLAPLAARLGSRGRRGRAASSPATQVRVPESASHRSHPDTSTPHTTQCNRYPQVRVPGNTPPSPSFADIPARQPAAPSSRTGSPKSRCAS